MPNKEKQINVLIGLDRIELLRLICIACLSLVTLWYFTLSGIEGLIPWVIIKLGLLSAVMPITGLMVVLLDISLPKNSVGFYVKLYHNCLPSAYAFRLLGNEQKSRITEHRLFLEQASVNLDKTPDDIKKLRKEVASAERKINAANKASSFATGYALGKKTEL